MKHHSHLTFFNIIKKAFGKAEPKKSRGKAGDSSFPEQLCRQFTLMEIRAAINCYREDLLLGQGCFGDVYKGRIDNGTFPVTIERYGPLGLQGTREFRTEVQFLCQLSHSNIISFVGFCDEEDEKFVVYEFISNGSLDKHIHRSCRDEPLSWKRRLEICIGAARGLHYLHSGAKHSIIHRNINSRNILLDDEWTPKLSNFSLSKLSPFTLPNSSSNMKAKLKGTAGYLDPECYRTGQVNEKSDVYSFGVVLFEILCGRKVIDLSLEEDEKHLTSLVCKCIENGTIYHIIDPYLKKKIAPESFKKFVEIAYGCVHEMGNGRPEMGEVENELELALELQAKADIETESMRTTREDVYEEVLFCRFLRNDVSNYGGNVVENDEYSDVESMNSGSFLDAEVIQLATFSNVG